MQKYTESYEFFESQETIASILQTMESLGLQ